MTHDQLNRLTPIVEGLHADGFIETYSTVSWPDGRGGYDYAFRIRTRRLIEPILVTHDFVHGENLRWAEAMAYTRQQHGDAIAATYLESQNQLIRDLAVIYAAQGRGKDLPVPREVTVKIDVRLDESTQKVVEDIRYAESGGAQ